MSGRKNPARMKRITKEVRQLAAKPLAGISFEVAEDNMRHLYAMIDGPQDSPYEGYRFKLEVFLPNEYPMKPPKIRFMTSLYHPNVDSVGRICVDILKDQWSPALTIAKVLISLQALLSAPNPDDPLAPDIGRLWKRDITRAHRNARNHARQHGIPIVAKRKADSQEKPKEDAAKSQSSAAKKRATEADGRRNTTGSSSSCSSSSSSAGRQNPPSDVVDLDDIEDDFDDASLDLAAVVEDDDGVIDLS